MCEYVIYMVALTVTEVAAAGACAWCILQGMVTAAALLGAAMAMSAGLCIGLWWPNWMLRGLVRSRNVAALMHLARGAPTDEVTTSFYASTRLALGTWPWEEAQAFLHLAFCDMPLALTAETAARRGERAADVFAGWYRVVLGVRHELLDTNCITLQRLERAYLLQRAIHVMYDDGSVLCFVSAFAKAAMALLATVLTRPPSLQRRPQQHQDAHAALRSLAEKALYGQGADVMSHALTGLDVVATQTLTPSFYAVREQGLVGPQHVVQRAVTSIRTVIGHNALDQPSVMAGIALLGSLCQFPYMAESNWTELLLSAPPRSEHAMPFDEVLACVSEVGVLYAHKGAWARRKAVVAAWARKQGTAKVARLPGAADSHAAPVHSLPVVDVGR